MNIFAHPEIFVHLLLALLFGMAIGIERQWRSRNAGMRTNTLISVGAALFTILGQTAIGDGDPTRVAAQIVSGIGFLGGGVIIKEKGSISGLNTAASLWGSAAVGALCGAGMWEAALAGVILVVFTNSALRPVARKIDRHVDPVEKGDIDYAIAVTCKLDTETEVRALLFEAVSEPNLSVRSFNSLDNDDDSTVTLKAVAHAQERDDDALERALRHVVPHPKVTEVKWSAVDI